jgi:hypothetical protein
VKIASFPFTAVTPHAESVSPAHLICFYYYQLDTNPDSEHFRVCELCLPVSVCDTDSYLDSAILSSNSARVMSELSVKIYIKFGTFLWGGHLH